MKIIIGLGNLGKEYEGTRHNAGFMFVETLAKQKDLSPANSVISFHTEKKFEAEIAEANANGEKIIFVKPRTYMNASGKTAASILDFYKSSPEDLIVVMDDVDLPLGTLRIRKEGGSGGHKGAQNIIDSIKNDKFTRIRIGIANKSEKENSFETAQFVLDKFSKRDLPVLEKVINMGIEYIVPFIGSKEVLPCHTLEIVPAEQRVE